MTLFLARLVVLLKATSSRLALAATVLGIIAAQLEPFTGDPTVARIVAFIAVTLTVIAVIVRLVANVTPVLEEAAGLLPPSNPDVPYTAREADLLAELHRVRQLHP